jgi:hypothetical protein
MAESTADTVIERLPHLQDAPKKSLPSELLEAAMEEPLVLPSVAAVEDTEFGETEDS